MKKIEVEILDEVAAGILKYAKETHGDIYHPGTTDDEMIIDTILLKLQAFGNHPVDQIANKDCQIVNLAVGNVIYIAGEEDMPDGLYLVEKINSDPVLPGNEGIVVDLKFLDAEDHPVFQEEYDYLMTLLDLN